MTLNEKDHGDTINLLGAAAITVSMPPATGSGVCYTFVSSVTATSQIIAANGTDIIQGAVIVATDDGGITEVTSATSDKMTLLGSTTGGVKGSTFTLYDIASGVWSVAGFLVSSAAEATPFSQT